MNEKTRKPKSRAVAGIACVILLCSAGAGIAGAQTTAPPAAEVLPRGVEKFIVKTRSKENAEVPFYVRVPDSYWLHSGSGGCRVLLSCPVFNGDGLKNLVGNSDLASVADERGWFIVSPTFKQIGAETHDRKSSYYYPETFSGQAVLDALDLIKEKFPISTGGLLLHGFSGGAQFVHRFALWAPDRVAAVVVNSSSWFDNPDERSQQVGWLVTIGESDPSYENTLVFVGKLRAAGAFPILRSYLAMTHERDNRVPKLDIEFLKFYDDLTRDKLGAYMPPLIPPLPKPVIPSANLPFVGDAQEWRYYRNTPETADGIPEEERIFLPSEPIAKLWGAEEQEAQ